MKHSKQILALSLALICSAVAGTANAHGPPPPGYTHCNYTTSGNTQTGQYYETWACDQGSVTCWDTDGDGKVNYAGPDGKGICTVAGNS